MINDRRHVRAVDGRPPCVSNYAVRAYRIRSRKFDRPNIRARHPYEEFPGKATISIKNEATDGDEPCAGRVETVAAVQCRVLAMPIFLRLHTDAKANHKQS